MGLLDMFGGLGNLGAEQTEGLLAAAARGLQNSGPSRTPVSLGQAAGFAIEGFQGGVADAKRRKMEQEQARQMAELRAMQIRDSESDYANQELTRDEAKRLADAYKARTSPEQQSFAAKLDYLGGDTRPTLANAAKLDSMPQTRAGTPGAPGGQSGGLYESLMSEAQWLKSQGFVAQAMAKEKEAITVRPKWNDKPQTVMGADGKPSLVQMADDGTVRPIQGGYGVANELYFGDLGGSIGAFDKFTGERKGNVAKSATPDAVMSNNRMRERMAFDREQANGGEAAFTPEAIDNAAARYNIDGTLPPMGMGKAGAAGRSAILNRAAVLAGLSGLSGDEQRIKQIGNKANAAALNKIQQQQTMVGAFEKNFVRNADIALEYSKKVDRSGIPIVNKWVNAGKRSVAGDPELAAFDASVKAVSNEYAKIVSGSMGNTATAEGEIKKIEGLLNAAQTPQQVSAVINLMKRETANRMKGFDEEKEALRGSMTTAPRKEESKPGAMQDKPKPNASNKGRVIVEHETGKRFRSNGLQWIEEK